MTVAPDANIETTGAETIERLTGLCRLWGTVKYFHPYLAYKDIDWDTALIETIPMVMSARSPEAYHDAIEHLLSFLGDPSSHATIGTPPAPTMHAPSAGDDRLPVRWTEDCIAIIDATEYERFSGRVAPYLFEGACAETRGAMARVFDLRRAAPSAASWFFSHTLLSAFPVFLEKPLQTSSTRTRVHSGYQSQMQGHQGYYSGMVTAAGPTIRAGGEEGDERFMIFLVDEHAYYPLELLGGLQASGRGAIVFEGELEEGSSLEGAQMTYRMALPGDVSAWVRAAEIVNPDGTLGLYPDRVVPRPEEGRDLALEVALDLAREGERHLQPHIPAQVGTFLPARPENPYREMECPAEEYRLLALFRFWNVIHYFFPYKDLLDHPWDDVLTEFISRFQAAGDELSYVLSVAELVTRIQDTHGFVTHPQLERYLGTHRPPLKVKTVQEETVVTAILDDAAAESICVGKVVLAVDGEAIEDRRARLEPVLAASTPQALRWRIDERILAGPSTDETVLTVRDERGAVRDVRLSKVTAEEWWQRRARQERPLPIFGLLTATLGYMDLTRLTIDRVDPAFEAIEDTRATIMDMRGYPRGIFETLGSRLAGSPATAALFQRPEWHGPDPAWGMSTLQGRQVVEPGPGEPYRGKVVVLINEEAISQSEHTCLWIEAATDVTFVGSPTNGANGDVTTTVLPGNIVVGFTGHDVRHGDGRQLQRHGIQPHIHVEPTIEGIRQGRDEVLEAAIAFLGEEGGTE